MAFNDIISGFSQYGSSTFESEFKMEVRLNELRNKLADEHYDYTNDLNNKSLKKQLEAAQKLYDEKLANAEKLEKARLTIYNKYQNKIKAAEKAGNAKEIKRLNEKYQKDFELYKKYLKKKQKTEEEQIKEQLIAEVKNQRESARKNLFDGSKNIRARFKEAKSLVKDQGFGALADALVAGLSDMAKQLNSQIDEIASYQSKINTRLQGSGRRWEGGFLGGKGISQTITGLAGTSPYIQQQKVVENLNKLVEKGIAYNVEQRAFLQTMSEKIATTFDAANGTLLQLIRVQQADTTASRLGMEAYLNRYLNSMYQTTEYLSDVSDTVSSALYEATAMMSATSGVGFEYQVQKWLGSLYSVGMSSSGVQSIAQALGMLGSGNISGLAGNTAMQNLLVMSASRAGLSYSELLTKGLDESNTNKLLQSMVTYLAEIAESNNNVIKAQYGSIFGMSMSDLKSIKNILPSIASITGSSLGYSGAMQELFNQADSMSSRMSIGERMSNMWANAKYSMASGIASSPALYGIWKISNMLSDTIGGIAIPAISIMGNMVDLETTVADIMRVSALAGGIFNSLGSIIGAGSGGGLSGRGILTGLGINQNTVSILSRGEGLSSLSSGVTTSQKAYVGNVSSGDVYGSTMASAEDTKNQAAVKADDGKEDSIEIIKDNTTNILDILRYGVVTVEVKNYGLTGLTLN